MNLFFNFISRESLDVPCVSLAHLDVPWALGSFQANTEQLGLST